MKNTKHRAGMISFETRYLQFVDKVYWYILLKVRNVHEAEDLTSQTFLKAYKAYPTLKDQEKFAPWVFRIARNLSMDFFRRSKQNRFEVLDSFQGDQADLLANAISSELSRQIQVEIQKLTKEEQDLLNLRFAAQLTFREIAEVLQRNESTVKKQYYSVIIQLKKTLVENEHS